MKRILALAATATAFTMAPAQASAAELELVLALDDSGSLGAANYALQRQAYVNVLSDPSILPTNGSVAIGVYKFNAGVDLIFGIQEITAGNIGALITAISNSTYAGGLTNIAGAIDQATSDIFSNAIDSDRQLIDVSTDGGNNVGNLTTSRNNALAAGIDQINCIGIGGGADCSGVQGGAGSFSLSAANINDFEASLRSKIKREVQGGVPEPTTWMMLLLGFFGMGAVMRRDKKTANHTVRVRYA